MATNGVGALGLVCATQAEIQCGVKIEADITTNPIMPQTSVAVLGKCKTRKMWHLLALGSGYFPDTETLYQSIFIINQTFKGPVKILIPSIRLCM